MGQQVDLSEFNAGGTHEENPIGGIPQGKHPDGTPNSVEEGETKLTVGGQKYVFSNKFNVAEKHIKALGLPTYVKGKPFSDASSEIVKRFKDRVDNASLSTQNAFLDRLVKAQETVKLEAAAKDAGMSVEEYIEAQAQAELEAAEAQVDEQAQQQAAQEAGVEGGEMPAGEEMPVEQQQFGDGGLLKNATITDAGKGQAANAAISGGLDMVSGIMQDQQSDKEVRDEISVGGSAAKYAMMGASAGSVVPGIGTAIGAGVGALAGAGSAMLSNDKIAGEKQTAERKDQGERMINEGYKSAYGGKLNIFDDGGDLRSPGELQFGNEFASDYNIDQVADWSLEREDELNEEKEDKNLLGKGALAASLAPFVGNLIEGASLEQDDPTRYQRVGRTYKPEFADERRALNVVDESFAGEADRIAAGSAGDLGAYRANLLGSSINKSKARQTAFENINDINRMERKALNADAAAAQKEEVDLYNKELIEQKQDKAAYDATRAAYRKAAYEGLGKIGETIFQTAQQKGLSPYNIFGKRKNTED